MESANFLKGKFVFGKMTENVPVIICTYELENGYILKNFFNFNSIRAIPTITFLEDKIISENRTADGKIYGSSYLHGDEIGLTWHVPPEKRELSLSFDASQNAVTFNRIKKKDEARITIAQMQSNPDYFDFDGPDSLNDFIIFVSCGGGGDRREGLQRIAARRVEPERLLIKQPNLKDSHLLIIPIRAFRQMMDSFSKCKKQSIRFCFYTNQSEYNGSNYQNKPGIMVTTDMIGGGKSGAILEKYGEIPEDESSSSFININSLNIDENAIVRTSTPIKLILEEEKELGPNEFVFESDKINIFTKLANMHNEGNVRIYYQPGCHLKIVHRFGGFGECEIALHNKYIKVF